MNAEEVYLYFKDLYNDGLSKTDKNEASYIVKRYDPEWAENEEITTIEIDHETKEVIIY